MIKREQKNIFHVYCILYSNIQDTGHINDWCSILICLSWCPAFWAPNVLSQDGTGFSQDTPRPCVKLCKDSNLNHPIPSRVAWDGRMGFCAPRYKRPVAEKASVSWIRTRNGRGPHGFHCRLVLPISTVVYYDSTDVIWLNCSDLTTTSAYFSEWLWFN